MFWSTNKENKHTPVYTGVTINYIKLGFKWVYFSWTYFPDV